LTHSFKVSNDPMFEEKVTHVFGLYLDPPERASALCATSAWDSGTVVLLPRAARRGPRSRRRASIHGLTHMFPLI
jgi:hypothetical protein